MTNQSSKLNRDDIKYLLGILQDEEVRQYTNIELKDNVELAKANLEKLQRIRVAMLNLDKEK
jgi:hypothetical protein